MVKSSLVVWLQGVYARMVNFAETLSQETTLACNTPQQPRPLSTSPGPHSASQLQLAAPLGRAEVHAPMVAGRQTRKDQGNSYM